MELVIIALLMLLGALLAIGLSMLGLQLIFSFVSPPPATPQQVVRGAEIAGRAMHR